VRLRREHGVRSFLAHNMTVTPANLAQIPEVITGTWNMAFGMLSFQPAAFLGDDRRWHEDYRATTSDQVWAEIERGAGTGLDYTVLANGDTRCNRTAYGVRVGSRWVPLLDGDDPRDLATRDAFFRFYGPVSLTGQPGWVITARLARVAAAHPRVVPIVAGWLARAVRRGGGPGVVARAALRGRVPTSLRPGKPPSAASSPTTLGSAAPKSGSRPATTPWPTPRPEPWSRPACSTPCSTRSRTSTSAGCCRSPRWPTTSRHPHARTHPKVRASGPARNYVGVS